MSVTMDILARALGPHNHRHIARPPVSARQQTAVLPDAPVGPAALSRSRRWHTAPRTTHPGLARPAPSFDLDLVLKRPAYREPDTARRLLFVGDLSPNAGAADLQAVLARWADRHSDGMIEMTWIGNGDLHVVLDAQPLPRNMQQRIIQPSAAPVLVDLLFDNGLIIVPTVSASHAHPLWEAAAAGLLIIGTAWSSQSRAAVSHEKTGWLYDPLVPDALFNVLTDVMATDDDSLNNMRVAARSHARQCLLAPVGDER